MRRLILAVALLIGGLSWYSMPEPILPSGGIQLVAYTSCQTGGCTTSAINTTGATLLVAIFASGQNSVNVSDNQSNTWHSLSVSPPNNYCYVQTFYAYNPNVSASHTFTSSGAQSTIVLVSAWSGTLTTSSVYDTYSALVGNGTSTLPTGPITPSEAGELILAGWATTAFYPLVAISSGLSIIDQGWGDGGIYGADAALIDTNASSINPAWTWGWNQGWQAANVAAFKPAVMPPSSSKARPQVWIVTRLIPDLGHRSAGCDLCELLLGREC
jgi:hypothetical protein